MKRLLISSIAFFSFFLTSCVEAPLTLRTIQIEGQKWDEEVGFKISEKLLPKFELRRDLEVSSFLGEILKKLADSTPEIGAARSRVFIIKDHKSIWHDFALPNHRIYLSAGLLRSVDFENEVAAAIAVQLAHLLERSLIKKFIISTGFFNAKVNFKAEVDKLQDTDFYKFTLNDLKIANKKVDYFSEDGVFCFSLVTVKAAFRDAVGILYRSGYDPRGLLSLLEKYDQNIANSPYDRVKIDSIREEVRREIAVFAPLRNPIVKTLGFLKIQKRMKRL